MKSDLMPSIVQMEAEVFKNLVTEVQETVATGMNLPRTVKPAFGLVDLWNIERNRKSAQRNARRNQSE